MLCLYIYAYIYISYCFLCCRIYKGGRFCLYLYSTLTTVYHVCVCIYIYMYTHMYIHIYAHTHIYMKKNLTMSYKSYNAKSLNYCV